MRRRLRLGHGDRVGLIGPNGSGKTTLLKIIAGEQEIDDGKVTRANGVRVGWLPQDIAVARRPLADRHDPVERARPRRARRAARRGRGRARGRDARRRDRRRRCSSSPARSASCTSASITSSASSASTRRSRSSPASASRPATSTATSASSPAAGRCAACSRACCSSAPTCCCSTSRPTTSTCRRSRGSRDFLKKWNRLLRPDQPRPRVPERADRARRLARARGRAQLPRQLREVPRAARRGGDDPRRPGEEPRARARAAHRRSSTGSARRRTRRSAVQSRVKMLEKMETVETYEKRGVMRFSFPPTARTVADVDPRSRA